MENQFLEMRNWTFEVLKAIRKDIRTEHLPSDQNFYRTYFQNRPLNRLTTEEIFEAYEKELLKGNEELSEWVVNRWVFKHGDLYHHFSERLSAINPNFDEIEELSEEESLAILEGAQERFGAIQTFLFTLLNGVVFPKKIRQELEKEALRAKEVLESQNVKDQEEGDLQKIIASQKREIARLKEKILGVQKKHTQDTESLKKQIKALQKKLSACG